MLGITKGCKWLRKGKWKGLSKTYQIAYVLSKFLYQIIQDSLNIFRDIHIFIIKFLRIEPYYEKISGVPNTKVGGTLRRGMGRYPKKLGGQGNHFDFFIKSYRDLTIEVF